MGVVIGGGRRMCSAPLFACARTMHWEPSMPLETWSFL